MPSGMGVTDMETGWCEIRPHAGNDNRQAGSVQGTYGFGLSGMLPVAISDLQLARPASGARHL
ncbi:hypothetical protein BRAS3809_450008 [Bradyrhizobium sp. STM 3809]|nr:hypothetical protein BRAS3809_450008 [Bradyrhizobium sp. STM 3809]